MQPKVRNVALVLIAVAIALIVIGLFAENGSSWLLGGVFVAVAATLVVTVGANKQQ